MVNGRPLSSTSLRFGNRKESPRGGGREKKTSSQGMHHMNDQWCSTSLFLFLSGNVFVFRQGSSKRIYSFGALFRNCVAGRAGFY